MEVTVNGQVRVVEACRVAELLPADPRGMAVAVNGEVVPRSLQASTVLSEGDVVEIVTAVQGG